MLIIRTRRSFGTYSRRCPDPVKVFKAVVQNVWCDTACSSRQSCVSQRSCSPPSSSPSQAHRAAVARTRHRQEDHQYPHSRAPRCQDQFYQQPDPALLLLAHAHLLLQVREHRLAHLPPTHLRVQLKALRLPSQPVHQPALSLAVARAQALRRVRHLAKRQRVPWVWTRVWRSWLAYSRSLVCEDEGHGQRTLLAVLMGGSNMTRDSDLTFLDMQTLNHTCLGLVSHLATSNA